MTTSKEIDTPFFPPDTIKDMQVKIKDHATDVAGNVISINKNDDACYEKAPTMEIAIEDFDFYMQVFSNYEKDKKKRAECQKKYFQKDKAKYYERQKKWRDGHKVDLNSKRRARYAAQKKAICDELPQPLVVPLEKEQEVPVSADELEHPPSEKDDDVASL